MISYREHGVNIGTQLGYYAQEQFPSHRAEYTCEGNVKLSLPITYDFRINIWALEISIMKVSSERKYFFCIHNVTYLIYYMISHDTYC